MHKEGEILIEASAKHIADMKDILKQQGVAHSNFKFVEGGKDSYSGRKADLLVKGDAGLGVEYKAADALDDPLLFLVRLADNTDITINRFSDLQKTKCFQSFYHILGEGPSGKLCNYLENIGKEKNGVEKAIKFIDDDPKLKSICGHLNIDFRNTKSTKDLLKNIKKGFIEETLSDTRYAKEVKTFGIDKMRKILGDQDSIALRHFGGCESVKNVELINGRLVVKVDVKQFNQLNKTKVTEKIKDSSGAFNNVSVGVGEYQIFRFMDANNSLVNNGKKVVIQVEDVGTGKILTSNFAQAFRKRIIN
jgi:hypothetical protein